MLKYVTRRFRDTYEKGCNILYTRKTWTCTEKEKKYVDKYENPSAENHEKSKGSKEHPKNDFNTDKYQTSWFQAVKLSSAFIIGWYAAQFAYLNCKRTCRTKIQNSYVNYPINHNILSKIAYAQPNLNQQTRSLHVFNVGYENDPNASHDVVDSVNKTEFEEASNNLEKIVGQIENKLGVASLISGDVASGLSQLKSGAEHGNAAANFNLGLCHELGIGVEKNYEAAANYYDMAARKGHTNAMYNLGVFYIQGRPGVKIDYSKARRFLLEAAEKGHNEAADALKMDPFGYLVMKQNIINVSQKTISI
uniref:Putative chitin synthase regulatory factor 2 pararge aegeria n=1 Tax=Xenopsylla cheopis TaxID=163159 RepID=A0A6M2DEB5_XENCH